MHNAGILAATASLLSVGLAGAIPNNVPDGLGATQDLWGRSYKSKIAITNMPLVVDDKNMATFNFTIKGDDGGDFPAITCSTGAPFPESSLRTIIHVPCSDWNMWLFLQTRSRPLRAQVDHRQPENTDRDLHVKLVASDGEIIFGDVGDLWGDPRIKCDSGVPPYSCDIVSGESIPMASAKGQFCATGILNGYDP